MTSHYLSIETSPKVYKKFLVPREVYIKFRQIEFKLKALIKEKNEKHL